MGSHVDYSVNGLVLCISYPTSVLVFLLLSFAPVSLFHFWTQKNTASSLFPFILKQLMRVRSTLSGQHLRFVALFSSFFIRFRSFFVTRMPSLRLRLKKELFTTTGTTNGSHAADQLTTPHPILYHRLRRHRIPPQGPYHHSLQNRTCPLGLTTLV